MGEDEAGEEDEEQEEQPRDGVGHDQGATDGAHEPEQADGHLVAQEVEQPEGEVPAWVARIPILTVMPCAV